MPTRRSPRGRAVPMLSLLLPALVATACGSDSTTPSGGGDGGGGSPNTVQVSNNTFSPQTITVPAHTTVSWVWSSTARGHDIIPTIAGGQPSEPNIQDGPTTYQHTFDTPGTYDYYCNQHGAPGSGMHGTVIVQ
jgi:plastocyanin